MAALKGLGMSKGMGPSQLKALKLDWYYAWQAKYKVGAKGFIPMIRDPGDLNEGAIKSLMEQLPKTQAPALLGFNEPDLKGQAEMSVADAIRLWPQLEATGLRLGSPATVSWNRPWMNEFMPKAINKGLRIDFLTMHGYGWPNAQSWLEKVDMFHEKWNLPIWITEYGVADWAASATKPNKYSRAETEDFMEETVAGFHERPFVERFAWKTREPSDYVMRPGHLFHSDGRMTSTGRLYSCL